MQRKAKESKAGPVKRRERGTVSLTHAMMVPSPRVASHRITPESLRPIDARRMNRMTSRAKPPATLGLCSLANTFLPSVPYGHAAIAN